MVTKVTGPETTTPDVRPADNVHHREVGHTLVNPIGPNQLDGPRLAARESRYNNSTEERAIIAAYDEAAFDRVRPMEKFFIAQADRLAAEVTVPNPVNGKPGLIDATEEIVTELNNLVTALERGGSASDLAERFKALQNKARHEALPRIGRTQHAIENSHLPRLADPYGAVQNTIAKMPYSSYRPIDPARYIKR